MSISAMSRVVFWSVWVVSALVATGWSTFCPVTSPNDEVVYVTDSPSRLVVGVTKTQCAVECSFSAGNNCRCFNYNVTSMNCSLFTVEPTNYAVDLLQNTVAYQIRETPLNGLWSTVPYTSCQFPFQNNGIVYCQCRPGAVFQSDPYCASVYHSCYLSNGSPAFCDATGEPQIPQISTNRPQFNISSSSTPRDCADIVQLGWNTSGVYTVYVGSTQRPLSVYCDMDTTGGGWTVFQRRENGNVDFYRNWTEYAKGFGVVDGEFWLGNDNIYNLTSDGRRYVLRFDLATFDCRVSYAEFDNFVVLSASDYYKLQSAGTYNGTAGDSFTKQVGKYFTTFDQDHDNSGINCAVQFKGAWWYDGCHSSNLNGHYYCGPHTSYADGLEWNSWTGYQYSLMFTEMKIRPF